MLRLDHNRRLISENAPNNLFLLVLTISGSAIPTNKIVMHLGQISEFFSKNAILKHHPGGRLIAH
jgi:hypothetical protein